MLTARIAVRLFSAYNFDAILFRYRIIGSCIPLWMLTQDVVALRVHCIFVLSSPDLGLDGSGSWIGSVLHLPFNGFVASSPKQKLSVLSLARTPENGDIIMMALYVLDSCHRTWAMLLAWMLGNAEATIGNFLSRWLAVRQRIQASSSCNCIS